MKNSRVIIALTFLFLLSGGYSALAEDHPITELYSDICVHPESGDLLGTRIAIFDFPEGTFVLFQIAEGEVAAPQFVRAEVNWETGLLKFKIKYDSGYESFSGKVTNTELIGRFKTKLQNPFGTAEFRLKHVGADKYNFDVCK